MREKDLVELNFNLLQAGTLIYVDTFRGEITDLVVARRITTNDGVPLKGYMFEGVKWCEYIEEISKLRRIMSI